MKIMQIMFSWFNMFFLLKVIFLLELCLFIILTCLFYYRRPRNIKIPMLVGNRDQIWTLKIKSKTLPMDA